MEHNSRPKYDREFKFQAVKLVTEEGYTIQEAASNLGVSVSALGRWKRSLEREANLESAFPGKGNLKPRDAAIHDLQKELERTRRERDILKKALGYFAVPRG